MPGGESIVLPDADAMTLFINFYKLLFLGSKFSRKMNKIEITDTKDIQNIMKLTEGGFTDDENLSDGIIQDTSDANFDLSDDNDEEIDPFQKIKIHANLCMRNIFKNNSKIIFNYWYVMFPSFMIRPVGELPELIEAFDAPELKNSALKANQRAQQRKKYN